LIKGVLSSRDNLAAPKKSIWRVLF